MSATSSTTTCRNIPRITSIASAGPGRAEQTGDALTLMVAGDASQVYAIERFISQKIRRVKLDDFDYQYTALFEEDKPGQKTTFPGKVRGARIRGGYYFGPAKRR